jgi:hypothetical protein
MKFTITHDEVKNILEMHSKMKNNKLINEQESPAPKTDDFEFLGNAAKLGCFNPGGKRYRNKTTGKVFYRTLSARTPTKTVDFYADMTYRFSDGSKSGKWQCPQIETSRQTDADNTSKIESLKKQNWKTRDELVGVDLNTIDKVYDKRTVGNTVLYKQKDKTTEFTQGTSTDDFNEAQNKFILRFSGMGYTLTADTVNQGSLIKVTDKELGAPPNLFPDGLVMWYNPELRKDYNVKNDRVLDDIITNQSIDRNVCRKNIKDYFESFRRRNSVVIDDASFTKVKQIVQACSDEHYGKWGIAGGGNRIDNYLDILSGNKEGGPTSYGDDSIWRIK